MSPKVKPIFIISLVRSGSTLLQRVLMSHQKINSMAEPWMLLPLVYAMKKEGMTATYDHSIAYGALQDVIENLPNKSQDYYRFLNEFASNVYNSLSNSDHTYFIDKTPRYYLIVEEIAKIFPEAKFIFLFRNPVHIYGSISSTFKNDRMIFGEGLYRDLKMGPERLSTGYTALKDRSIALKYEDFVSAPEKHLKEVTQYLELDYDETMLSKFCSQDLKGRSFDPTGTVMYKTINSSTLDKWKKIFNTRYRKGIIQKYVERLDAEVLEIQGYNKSAILKSIHEMDTNGKYGFFRDYKDVNKAKIKKNINKMKKKITSYL